MVSYPLGSEGRYQIPIGFGIFLIADVRDFGLQGHTVWIGHSGSCSDGDDDDARHSPSTTEPTGLISLIIDKNLHFGTQASTGGERSAERSHVSHKKFKYLHRASASPNLTYKENSFTLFCTVRLAREFGWRLPFIYDCNTYFLFLGVVPKRSSEMATYGDKAGEQDGGEVFPGRVPGDGYVPRADGVHPVAAPPQPAIQRHGGTTEPKLHGLPIAPVLRFMSAALPKWTLKKSNHGSIFTKIMCTW